MYIDLSPTDAEEFYLPAVKRRVKLAVAAGSSR
jgi:hypothetical protein